MPLQGSSTTQYYNLFQKLLVRRKGYHEQLLGEKASMNSYCCWCIVISETITPNLRRTSNHRVIERDLPLIE
jgi:hypothetical protein